MSASLMPIARWSISVVPQRTPAPPTLCWLCILSVPKLRKGSTAVSIVALFLHFQIDLLCRLRWSASVVLRSSLLATLVVWCLRNMGLEVDLLLDDLSKIVPHSSLWPPFIKTICRPLPPFFPRRHNEGVNCSIQKHYTCGFQKDWCSWPFWQHLVKLANCTNLLEIHSYNVLGCL